MTDEIDDIRSRLDVARLIEQDCGSDDGWTSAAGSAEGRCHHPHHGHSSGSNANSSTNLIAFEDGWFCHSHEQSGDVFDWIAVSEGICTCSELPMDSSEFKQVLKIAADMANVELSGGDRRPQNRPATEASTYVALQTAIDILHTEIDTAMLNGRTVRWFLKETRGFDDDTIDAAKIGYFHGPAEPKLLDALTKDELKAIGFMDGDENWQIHERIIYPYMDELPNGIPVYWIGRKTTGSKRRAKYLKPMGESAELTQPAYHAPSFTRGRDREVWVVEGIQDALSLAQDGHAATSPVATNPSQTQTDHIQQITDEYENVVLCYDNDESGIERQTAMGLNLMERGMTPDVARFPDDLDADDPNDLYVSGGSAADIEEVSFVEAYLDVHGTGEHIVRDLLGTVEPNTPRADRVVDEIARKTSYRKRTLRKIVKQSYRKESQSGWIEPDRVEKTEGQEPLWVFRFPSGESIVLTTEQLHTSPDAFEQRYMELFNFDPNFDREEWARTRNEWLQEVVVTDPDPLTKERSIVESVLESIQSAVTKRTLLSCLQAAAGGIVYDPEDNDGEIIVPKASVEAWVDDMDISLRKLREYLSPYLTGNTKRVTVGGKGRVRVWFFDAEAIEEEGYSISTPILEQTPEEEAMWLNEDEDDDDGDSSSDGDDDDDDDMTGTIVTDGGVDIVGHDRAAPNEAVKLHGPPGTGKTTQLEERLVALLEGPHDYTLDDVAIVTYRREMAHEMLHRLVERGVIAESELSEPWKGPTRYIGTLHAVCNRLIDRDREVAEDYHRAEFVTRQYDVEYSRGGTDLDEGETADGVGRLLFDAREWMHENLRSAAEIESWGGYGDLRDEWPGSFVPNIESFDRAWQSYKDANGLYDFLDMLVEINECDIGVGKPVVIVDEYHDFTPLMDAIARTWLQQAEVPIVAGDPLQAIYTYKGADPSMFRSIEYPEVLLNRSYRVPQQVWDYATGILEHDAPPVTPDHDNGEVVTQYLSPSGAVAEYGSQDIMLLARTQAQVRAICSNLKDEGIIFRAQSRMGGWNEASVRLDLYNVLKKLESAAAPDASISREGQSGLSLFDSDTADGGTTPLSSIPLTDRETSRLIRYTPAEYINGTKKSVKQWAQAVGDITADQLVDHVTREFWTAMTRGANSVDTLLKYDGKEAIAAALDRYHRPFPEIELAPVPDVLTIHAAKGKEAETVVVYDGITPRILTETMRTVAGQRAESRVWYVACTRAAKRLVVVPQQFNYTHPYLPHPDTGDAIGVGNAVGDD